VVHFEPQEDLMKNILVWLAPTLLLIGTAGLLLNEFYLDWGRPATLTFALFNIIGIALLISISLQKRNSNEKST
jgi:hypothetical protein